MCCYSKKKKKIVSRLMYLFISYFMWSRYEWMCVVFWIEHYFWILYGFTVNWFVLIIRYLSVNICGCVCEFYYDIYCMDYYLCCRYCCSVAAIILWCLRRQRRQWCELNWVVAVRRYGLMVAYLLCCCISSYTNCFQQKCVSSIYWMTVCPLLMYVYCVCVVYF